MRLRTWVNGELVQDDSTAGLLFPLAQIVADLSQHFTLETGDVILTGTPAGSSVVVPGDVVEVQVDAGTQSTGRLRTTVAQGGRSFDGAVGSLPAADDTQRTEAWGSAEAAAAPREQAIVPKQDDPPVILLFSPILLFSTPPTPGPRSPPNSARSSNASPSPRSVDSSASGA